MRVSLNYDTRMIFVYRIRGSNVLHTPVLSVFHCSWALLQTRYFSKRITSPQDSPILIQSDSAFFTLVII